MMLCAKSPNHSRSPGGSNRTTVRPQHGRWAAIQTLRPQFGRPAPKRNYFPLRWQCGTPVPVLLRQHCGRAGRNVTMKARQSGYKVRCEPGNLAKTLQWTRRQKTDRISRFIIPRAIKAKSRRTIPPALARLRGGLWFLDFVFHAVTFSFDDDRLGVVEEAIEHG